MAEKPVNEDIVELKKSEKSNQSAQEQEADVEYNQAQVADALANFKNSYVDQMSPEQLQTVADAIDKSKEGEEVGGADDKAILDIVEDVREKNKATADELQEKYDYQELSAGELATEAKKALDENRIDSSQHDKLVNPLREAAFSGIEVDINASRDAKNTPGIIVGKISKGVSDGLLTEAQGSALTTTLQDKEFKSMKSIIENGDLSYTTDDVQEAVDEGAISPDQQAELMKLLG